MPQLITLEEYEKQSKHTSIGNFGPPKNGKTKSIETLFYLSKNDPHFRIDHLDFDYGADPIFRYLKDHPEYAKMYRVYRFGKRGRRLNKDKVTRDHKAGFDIIMDVMSHINSYYDISEKGLSEWHEKGPRIIIWDTMTELNKVILDYVLKCVGHEIGDPKTDARTDFGKQMDKLQEFIDASKELPCISIFNFHEKKDKDDLKGYFRIDPQVTGQQAYNINGAFGCAIYSMRKGDDYIWQIKPSQEINSTGTRFADNLPEFIPQDYAILLGDKQIGKEVIKK